MERSKAEMVEYGGYDMVERISLYQGHTYSMVAAPRSSGCSVHAGEGRHNLIPPLIYHSSMALAH